jgi:hypothetical protein
MIEMQDRKRNAPTLPGQRHQAIPWALAALEVFHFRGLDALRPKSLKYKIFVRFELAVGASRTLKRRSLA